jgi:hypothetical protein
MKKKKDCALNSKICTDPFAEWERVRKRRDWSKIWVELSSGKIDP